MDAITLKKRLWFAVLLLACAAFAAGASWFCLWDKVTLKYPEGYPAWMDTRATRFIVHASSIGFFNRFPFLGHSRREELSIVVMTGIACSFLLAPLLALTLSRARLLRVIWIFLDLCLLSLMISGWLNYVDGDGLISFFVIPIKHSVFLPGFYLACIAVLLHFAGLFLIPSAKSLDRPTLPASE